MAVIRTQGVTGTARTAVRAVLTAIVGGVIGIAAHPLTRPVAVDHRGLPRRHRRRSLPGRPG
ncbi:hypothetical protein, partial [Candidatus Protofrankia californiensis]|uniref:hypothetical protein n=1 Tax=Candidatus Protofrankia californiensis TaxID=1839754 RepID=UPI0019D06988